MQLHRVRQKQMAGRGGLDEDRGKEVLKSTASHRPIPPPLHQPPIHYLSAGLIGSDERWNAVEQPELLVWRVEVDQVDDEDGRKSSHRRSCANSSALPIQLVWKWLDVP